MVEMTFVEVSNDVNKVGKEEGGGCGGGGGVVLILKHKTWLLLDFCLDI